MYTEKMHLELTWWKRVGLNLLISLSYVIAGNIGMLFTTYNTSSSPLWPPSGLALAMVLIYGIPQVLPGITLGVLLLGLQGASPSITIGGLIAANLIESVMASMLLHSFGKGYFRFKKPKDIFIFILVAVLLSPFVSSTLGVGFLYSGDMIVMSNVPKAWLELFCGSSLGILVFTPLILSFYEKYNIKNRAAESVVLCLILTLLSYWAFEGDLGRKLVLLPLMTWAALRFSFRGVSIAAVIIGFISIWRSTYLLGVFDNFSPEDDLIMVQAMIGGIVIFGHLMAAAKEAELTSIAKELESTVNKQHKLIAEEALSILDQTIHKSTIGFALIDKNYKFIRINEAMVKLHGIDDRHLGKSLYELSPSIIKLMAPLIEKVFVSGISLLNFPYKESSVGLLSCYPIRNPVSNDIFAVAINFQDMSEELKTQNLLRENQARLTFAQEAGRIGAFEWDSKSNQIFWTPELENIYGLKTGEFGGFYGSWMKWIHPEDLEPTVEAVHKVLGGEGELNHQFRIITNAKTTRWILARGKMVKDDKGKNLKFIGINIDLTEQKSIEQKLRLTEANLLHALSVRDEFMGMASHELKTPLTSLKLQIQLYQRGLMKNNPIIFSPEKIKDMLEKNSRHIDRLTRLVDDMLDISRIRTGKLSLRKESCDLKTILLEILNRITEQPGANQIEKPILAHVDHAEGFWDPLRIEQVLTNLITNAIRYGQGKPISISIKNYQETVRITIKDQGLGIAKSDQEKIFKRYERGLLAREVSGLGLGLFISKQIVDAHSGKIWVESEVNQGAIFYVDLPRETISVSQNSKTPAYTSVEC